MKRLEKEKRKNNVVIHGFKIDEERKKGNTVKVGFSKLTLENEELR